MSTSAILSAFGHPEGVIELTQSHNQSLVEGEVRVKMIAAPINPADINLIQGVYGIRPSLPATAGIEGFGKIIESRASEFDVGSRVIFTKQVGTWAEEVVAPSSSLLQIPAETPPQQAAMLKVNPLTAWCMLTQLMELEKGAWVIQNAANSGVGCCVIQIANCVAIIA